MEGEQYAAVSALRRGRREAGRSRRRDAALPLPHLPADMRRPNGHAVRRPPVAASGDRHGGALVSPLPPRRRGRARPAGRARRRRLRPDDGGGGDETDVRVGRKRAYRYHAIAAPGPVVDVLRRAHRDLPSARACFVLAIGRRRAAPHAVITGQHPASARAIREEVPGAVPTRSGRHRAPVPPTQPVARSPVPTEARRRPMRGLQAIRTGQHPVEGVALARAAAAPDPSAHHNFAVSSLRLRVLRGEQSEPSGRTKRLSVAGGRDILGAPSVYGTSDPGAGAATGGLE